MTASCAGPWSPPCEQSNPTTQAFVIPKYSLSTCFEKVIPPWQVAGIFSPFLPTQGCPSGSGTYPHQAPFMLRPSLHMIPRCSNWCSSGSSCHGPGPQSRFGIVHWDSSTRLPSETCVFVSVRAVAALNSLLMSQSGLRIRAWEIPALGGRAITLVRLGMAILERAVVPPRSTP